MKGFKAFGKGLICRGKQYKENTVFEEEKAEICECGMHFCENPLDVLEYYPLVDDNGDMIEVAEVEALDECKTDDKKKFCTKKLKIGAKLSLKGFINAAVDFIYEKCTEKDTDDSAKLASSGDSAQLASSGYYAKLASSGYSAQLASSGDSAQLASSGDYAKLASSGYSAVIAGIGIRNTAKGKIGSWITLAEWRFSREKNRWIPVCVKTEQIDGEKIKEDTFYQLKNGEFVEYE